VELVTLESPVEQLLTLGDFENRRKSPQLVRFFNAGLRVCKLVKDWLFVSEATTEGLRFVNSGP
jgi:hypothetical protein